VKVKIKDKMMQSRNSIRRKQTSGKAYRVHAVVFFTMMVLFFTLNAISCKQQAKPEEIQKPADNGIHKSYSRGPLVCTVGIDKSEMTIADRLNLTITIIVDENYEVELPSAGEKLAQFGIVDYHTSAFELTDDHKKKISRSYVLEPFLSGDYAIPAMTVGFWKNDDQGKDKHTLETEEIKIYVKSLLPENFKDMKLHDIRPPVELPGAIPLWMWLAGIGGLAVIGAITFLVVLKRRKQRHIIEEKSLSPHEQAYIELERLILQNLIEKGEIKLFYFEITNILRRYIENRFGINAPEQTTEEFLEGLKKNTDFLENYRVLLKNFLSHCDLVKFAAHLPSTDDIQNTFNSCKEFISETKVTE
jgi:hypothetical protein